MIMAENKQQHTTSPVSCLHGQMYHHANSISSLAATSAPGYPLSTLSPNVIANPKQHPTHSVIPVVQPAVVAQIDPRVIVEHRDGQFVTIPTIELQPIPQTDINEKIAIYRHPLFPLLRILFEKCELSTSYVDLINGGTFDTEIKEFITQMARENKPFFTDDADVDNLMLKSLQVLRIHLLELEKVNELCKDFCTRYISCLKGKLNSENIMKTLDIGSSSTSPIQSPSQTTSQNSTPDSPTAVDNDDIPSNTERSASQLSESKSSSEDVDLLPQSSTSASSENMTNDQDDRTVATNLHIQRLTSGFLSKKNKGTKRGVLPKSATTVLKGWLFQHLVHPYPTEDEKRELALQTNLSNLQVNNWFINARRRILQPMLESSNSFLKTNKKSKQQRNAAQKDWTNTIGVYNAYRTEALQSTASDSNSITNGLVGSVAWVPSNSPMLVTLPNRTATHSVQGQPIHFLQMPQIPIQTGSSTYLPTAANPTSPNQVLTSCQQTITLPIYSQTVPVSQAKHNSNVAG